MTRSTRPGTWRDQPWREKTIDIAAAVVLLAGITFVVWLWWAIGIGPA